MCFIFNFSARLTITAIVAVFRLRFHSLVDKKRMELLVNFLIQLNIPRTFRYQHQNKSKHDRMMLFVNKQAIICIKMPV